MRPMNLVPPAWRNSDSVSALADGERHLGHVLRIGGRWHAFDATHSNERATGFRSLGSFVSRTAAKDAVEQSCWPAIPWAGVA